jgi:hypothetical protein
MKELANGLAQLAAIIMIVITLAVSISAVSQWASSDGTNGGSAVNNRVVEGPQTLVATDAR